MSPTISIPFDPRLGLLSDKLNVLEKNFETLRSVLQEPSLPPPVIPNAPRKPVVTPKAIVEELKRGTPESTSAFAYENDEGFKEFVDHYKQGALQDLPQWAQEHFDEFAVSMYYQNQSSQERQKDVEIIRARGKQPEGFLQNVANLALAPATFITGGILDSLAGIYGVTDDEFTVSRALADKFSFGSFESNVQTVAHQAELGGMIMQATPLAPLGTVLAGVAGAADVAARGLEGQPVTGGQMAAEAGKQAAFTRIAQPVIGSIAAGGLTGRFLTGGTTAIQRMWNTGVIGGTLAPIFTALGGTVDAIAFDKDPKEIPKETLASIPFGFITAFLLQGGIEALNQIPHALRNWVGKARSPEVQNRQAALRNDANADAPLRTGVSARDVVHMQEMTPHERQAALKVNEIAREVMLKKGSNANIKTVQGELIMGKLKTVMDVQDRAGKTLGAIREKLPIKKTITTAKAESRFLEWLDGLGIRTKGNELEMSSAVIDERAHGFIKNAWNILPNNQNVSPQQVDTYIQKVNMLMKHVPSGSEFSSTRAALGILKDSLRSELIAGMPKALRPDYSQAVESYAKSMEVLSVWARILRSRGEQAMSVSDLKMLLRTGDRSLKAGEIARRLLGNAEGTIMPMILALDDILEKNPYLRSSWKGSVLNIAKYTDTVEKLLKLQAPTGLGGEVKSVVSEPMQKLTGIGKVKELLNLFGSSPLNIFDAMDEYLLHLQKAGMTPSANATAAATAIGKEVDAKIELLQGLSEKK